MNVRGAKISPFFLSVAAVLTVTAAICISAASCYGYTVSFPAAFYFVCYSVEDNAVSASSVSGAVSNYGGAGYILEIDGAYYVTVACYYTQNDAQTVCASLKKRDLDCEVLAVETEEYRLQSFGAKQYAALYRGNLNTLYTLSTLAYDCANALDTGEYTQSMAASVTDSILSALNGLYTANADNCFSSELRRLIAACRDAGSGYIYSKDLRRLQIAVADTVIHIALY